MTRPNNMIDPYKAITRIGRVKAYETFDRAHPWFRLVIENGRMTLGCWRAVSQEQPDPISYSRRTIFERVS
jgi:hypothetical protein